MIRIDNPRENDRQITPHFKASEFACRHCGRTLIDERLVRGLEELRIVKNEPITITSGYRCIDHPLSNGRETSQHTIGRAADFIFGNKFNIIEVFNDIIQIPEIRRIGIYSGGYIHVDTKNEKLFWICYDSQKGKEYRYFNDLTSFYNYVYNDKRIDWTGINV
jgi:uncharacterized protein (DUF488 family)